MEHSEITPKRRFRIMPVIIMALMGIGIFMLISASKDMSTYSTFDQARRAGETTKVVGVLAKDKPMYYDAEKDPNLFRFYMTDQAGKTLEVSLKAPKPQDFELSEQVVATGAFEGDMFVAESILMKCPSKYKNEEVFARNNM